MNLIEYLKKEESFDKYLLFLMALKNEERKPLFSKADIIRLTGVSKQGLYNVISRNRRWLVTNGIEVPKIEK